MIISGSGLIRGCDKESLELKYTIIKPFAKVELKEVIT